MSIPKKHLLASAATLCLLAACGGESSNAAPTASDITLDGAKLWLPLEGSFKAADVDGNALKISRITANGATVQAVNGRYALATGVLEVNGLNFVFTPLSAAATQFSYEVSDGSKVATATVKIAAALSDPLVEQQWHLRNTGQKAYSMSDSVVATESKLYQLLLGMSEAEANDRAAKRINPAVLKAGEDMNVVDAYAAGSTGQNTIAVVVDTGLEIRHEDLAANVLPNRSLNLIPEVVDPTDPTSTEVYGDHGTSVAGLIAAVGWNGVGGHGVAPNTKLIGINYLQEQSALTEMLSHGAPGSGIGVNDPIAVFNRSYGYSWPSSVAYSEAEEEMHAYSATRLRGGKGAINAKAAGNSFRSGGFEGPLCRDNLARTLGLTCYNANFQASQATPYYFVVGAVNSDGGHTSYSSAGANLLVSAPAGEFGTFSPAMVTTDQSTCLRGYSSFANQADYDSYYFTGFFAGYFPFDNPGHADNLNCNYTSTFNGTSSATPNMAGVVALILAANPALSFRDVRDILVKSSTKVDASNATVTLATGNGSFVAHPGWVKNAAGFEFNNLYGYGRVNAGKAVQMAKTATPLGTARTSAWSGAGVYASKPASLALAVPDNSNLGAQIQLQVTDDITVEGVQFKLSISNPEYSFGFYDANWNYSQTTAGIDLAIEAISPSGTRSVLLSSKQALIYPALDADFYEQPGYILKDAVFLSNAFYGEKAKGTWTLRVLDVGGTSFASSGNYFGFRKFVNNTIPTQVDGVAVRAFGH